MNYNSQDGISLCDSYFDSMDLILIDDYIELEDGEFKYHPVDIKEYRDTETNNIIYYCMDEDVGTYCNFIPSQLDDVENWNDGYNLKNPKNIYDSYLLDIWIPISDLKIQLSDKDYPRIVGQYLTNNNKMVHTRLGYYYNIRIGDYIHTIIYPRQCGSDIKIGVFIEDKDNN